MEDKILGRLARSKATSGPVSPQDALSRALFFAGTGQILPSSSAKADNTLQDKIALEEVKARLKSQNINPLNDQLKQAQIDQAQAETEAMRGPLPEGLTRVGRNVVNTPGYISPEKQFEIDEKKSDPDRGLTAGQRNAKDVATKEIFSSREMNQAKKKTLDNAIEGSDRIPKGIFGKMSLGASKMFGFKNPAIKEQQELKIALTEGTLANTAWTKGAISDQEMNLFKEASANDDFNSPAIVPVLEKLRRYMDAEEAGLYGAYQKNYGEDPRSWFGQGQPSSPIQPPTSKIPSFATEAEAEASGMKGDVMIAGRRARID